MPFHHPVGKIPQLALSPWKGFHDEPRRVVRAGVQPFASRFYRIDRFSLGGCHELGQSASPGARWKDMRSASARRSCSSMSFASACASRTACRLMRSAAIASALSRAAAASQSASTQRMPGGGASATSSTNPGRCGDGSAGSVGADDGAGFPLQPRLSAGNLIRGPSSARQRCQRR